MMMYNQRLVIKAKFFRGLADPTRLSIMETLLDGDKSVGEIVGATHQSQSNISNHLKCLLECGLVNNRREGKNILYAIRNDEIKELLKDTDKVLSKIHNEIAMCVDYEQ